MALIAAQLNRRGVRHAVGVYSVEREHVFIKRRASRRTRGADAEDERGGYRGWRDSTGPGPGVLVSSLTFLIMHQPRTLWRRELMSPDKQADVSMID